MNVLVAMNILRKEKTATTKPFSISLNLPLLHILRPSETSAKMLVGHPSKEADELMKAARIKVLQSAAIKKEEC